MPLCSPAICPAKYYVRSRVHDLVQRKLKRGKKGTCRSRYSPLCTELKHGDTNTNTNTDTNTCRSRYSPLCTELSIGLGFVLCESRKIGLPSSLRQVMFG